MFLVRGNRRWRSNLAALRSRLAALLRTIDTAALLHGAFTVGLPVLILRWTDGIRVLATSIGEFRCLGAALVGFGIYL